VAGSKDTDPDAYQNVTDPDLQYCESGLVSFWKPDPDTYQSEKLDRDPHQSQKQSGSIGIRIKV
jgi:hypothetical protein